MIFRSKITIAQTLTLNEIYQTDALSPTNSCRDSCKIFYAIQLVVRPGKGIRGQCSLLFDFDALAPPHYYTPRMRVYGIFPFFSAFSLHTSLSEVSKNRQRTPLAYRMYSYTTHNCKTKIYANISPLKSTERITLEVTWVRNRHSTIGANHNVAVDE